jgi:hypothetical protein
MLPDYITLVRRQLRHTLHSELKTHICGAPTGFRSPYCWLTTSDDSQFTTGACAAVKPGRRGRSKLFVAAAGARLAARINVAPSPPHLAKLVQAAGIEPATAAFQTRNAPTAPHLDGPSMPGRGGPRGPPPAPGGDGDCSPAPRRTLDLWRKPGDLHPKRLAALPVFETGPSSSRTAPVH